MTLPIFSSHEDFLQISTLWTSTSFYSSWFKLMTLEWRYRWVVFRFCWAFKRSCAQIAQVIWEVACDKCCSFDLAFMFSFSSYVRFILVDFDKEVESLDPKFAWMKAFFFRCTTACFLKELPSSVNFWSLYQKCCCFLLNS